MALGQLASLGFASNVLKQDIMDKMKKAEEKDKVEPYTKKVEENTTKQKDLTEIKTKLLTFQTAVSSLADATAFAKRKVVGSITENPPASLTANSGVSLQSMKVNVTQIAQKDVYQSKGLTNDSGYVNANLTKATDLTFFSNGKEYTVSVDKNTTYKDLTDKINAASGGEIVAKIVNTGEKNTPYRLTLTSKETGEDHAISFYAGKKDGNGKYTESNESKEIFKNLGWELDTTGGTIDPAKDKKGYGIKDNATDPLHIQKAQNAEFTLDGIKMIRSSNTITDLGVGLTLTLNKTGEINFDVQQDNEAVTKTMQELVDAYNNLVSNLNAATDYNSETGTKGTLQGVTEVNSIRSSITSILFDSQSIDGTVEDKNGNKVKTKVMLSMQDFGLSLTDSGSLSFDSSKFEKKVKENPDLTESFFSNITKYEDINHTGDLIKEGSLKQYVGTGTNNGLEFKQGEFTIVYNNQSYDISKARDGSTFKLTGATEQEMLQNLATHINSLGIEGLSVKVEAYDKNNQKGWELKIKGDGGSNFSIKGNKDFLKKFGLSETNITAKPVEGKGVFSKLKSTLQGMTGTKGSLTKYDESLTNDTKTLNKAKESAQKAIDTKYDSMANQWLQYESILNKLNQQLNTVTNMINAANNSNN
ncbi:TPA: flagellar filament capping protein FliD [Campylobacter coli]|uniref:flagellar filament capping protein FliD n=1 Tax=Campylobacter coli TaxID=195 RepID=UPI0012CEA20C|nr:flagellar filament capping protein FliD [Campylobacter coli]EJF7467035.1 flagellar filament capping protein FliD [Campylobacter coli]EJY0236395.1 flagellar filament capping protein FliD [Campylobacter coli]HED8048959.1 flagellar filament capping protein FliD [Campylobacter coli]HEF2461416.1 flagellar filament capping protein FliD [Campylobacter coli]